MLTTRWHAATVKTRAPESARTKRLGWLVFSVFALSLVVRLAFGRPDSSWFWWAVGLPLTLLVVASVVAWWRSWLKDRWAYQREREHAALRDYRDSLPP
jgi:hypothetical protein